MIFNSLSFLLFFLFVVIIYYFLFNESAKAQNILLLVSSYFFYGVADWKILPLLIIVTLSFFGLGIAIKNADSSPKKSSLFTALGVITGLGMLVYFKYFNFFLESFVSLFKAMGLNASIGTFKIIMPLGISFYTFKLISYVIEIYRGKIEPTRDVIAFSVYIAFFPTILSGPIDRPFTFIPQLHKKRSFDYKLVADGCRQILWGLFQKVVIADSLAGFINGVWGSIPDQSGGVLLIAAILYTVQMYTDFSGYSDMAIGVGKILGLKITKNFNYPFFRRNIAEYWRNWHMSLTSWLTDYIFIPLTIKFRNYRKFGTILAALITFIAIGMWHGANWTFAVFGLYHGLLYIPLILANKHLKNKKLKANKYGLPSIIDSLKMIRTFLLVTFGLIIFRAENIRQFREYVVSIFGKSSVPFFEIQGSQISLYFTTLAFSVLFFILEWIAREDEYALATLGLRWYRPLRYLMYFAFIIVIILNGGKEQQFIYFQF